VALFCVLVIDPRAVLQGATWLSFGAVFVLTLLFSKRVAPQGILQSSFKMNAGIFLSMFGLLAYLSLPVSWSSPVVNLIAVPMVIFLLLPFGALIFLMVVAGCPDVPMFLAVFESLFQYYWKLLVWFSDAGLVTKVNIGSSVFLCLLFVGCINLLPISFRARCASAVMFFLFYNYVPVPKSTRYLVNVLDVGQGTSVQITDAQNTLLYDFGPAYGGTADAGERVILPQLQVQGIRFVDVAVISHNDLDHRGGFESVSNQIDYDMLLAGQPDLLSQSAIDCRTVSTLRAGGLTAEVLWPRFEDVSGHVSSRSLALPNNQSCVLKVMVGGVSVLITGDIDVDIERLLVSLHGDSLRSDVLIVGHHGSATSSSWAFLKTVKPKIAIYSAAYKGRFGHPAKIIEERFQRLGIPTYNTATSGAIALQPVTLSPFNFGYDKKTDSVSRLNSTGADFVSYSGKRIAILEARRERALFWVAY
jgi:competence protein ComEC